MERFGVGAARFVGGGVAGAAEVVKQLAHLRREDALGAQSIDEVELAAVWRSE
jgi:hypothetical protein